jgi:hypothetical protein
MNTNSNIIEEAKAHNAKEDAKAAHCIATGERYEYEPFGDDFIDAVPAYAYCSAAYCTQFETLQHYTHEHDNAPAAKSMLVLKEEHMPSTGGTGSGTSSTSFNDEPTDKQVAFLMTLISESNARVVGLSAEDGEMVTSITIESMKTQGRWTKRNVSALIDKLLAQAKGQAPVAASAAKRTNKFAARCTKCKVEVPEGAGQLNSVNGKWEVSHLDGECATSAPAAPLLVPAGHYAVESSGVNDLNFYRVDVPTSGAYAGSVFVKVIIGGHPDINVPRSKKAAVLQQIADAGVEASARLYGTSIGRCCQCNRTLTDEVSRAAGIGPECAKRV